MKEAVITRISGAPDWSIIPIIAIDECIKTTHTEVTASAQICYDDQALYLRLCTQETEIRREEHGFLAMPCNDSCLEFFFCPKEDDFRYFNLEFNPNTTLYLGFGTSVDNLSRIVLSEEGEQQKLFCTQVNFTADGWEITYQIPYTFIRRFFPEFSPVPGKTIRANFYKCANMVSKPHYLAWNPITRQGKSVFHTPKEFGRLYFG
ncbi:MAG: carbohydrate-binding family 9-like protein [Lachnospiraceae bacterium]|nr:carbohydrate-binding family 9-like protein [Lachnospiraceae bacterium]